MNKQTDALKKPCLFPEGALNYENYTEDNSFFEDTVEALAKEATLKGYTLLGLGKAGWLGHTHRADDDLAIVFETREGVRWCHLSKIHYFHLLESMTSRKEAEKTYEEVLTALRCSL